MESWMPRPHAARVDLWAPLGMLPKVWAPREAQRRPTKHATKKPRRVRRSDRPGWWLDRQPLFRGQSDRWRPQSDRQQWRGPEAVEAAVRPCWREVCH
jgi:hypothetical protein